MQKPQPDQDFQKKESSFSELCNCLTEGFRAIIPGHKQYEETDLMNGTSQTTRQSINEKHPSNSIDGVLNFLGLPQKPKPLNLNQKDERPPCIPAAGVKGLAQSWVSVNDQEAIDQRKQKMLASSTRPDENSKYIFKSLLRQDYFNQRFKENQVQLKQECQREIKNFFLMSELLPKPEQINYCQDITASYLIKYFPYQCSLCSRFASEILVAQCSTQEQISSCNSPICMDCSLEFYQFMKDSEDAIHECGFCGKSLVLERDPVNGLQLLPQDSRFSNIEELDAEYQDDSLGGIEFPENGSESERSQDIEGIQKVNTTETTERGAHQQKDVLRSPYKKELDNMIIRDATAEEKEQIMIQTKIVIAQKDGQPVRNDQPRCSLIQMTPRGEAAEGWESARSESIQLTGFKPKALEFASPPKSPPTRVPFSSASTKDNTTFGLSNCIFKCEMNPMEGSPEVEENSKSKQNEGKETTIEMEKVQNQINFVKI